MTAMKNNALPRSPLALALCGVVLSAFLLGCVSSARAAAEPSDRDPATLEDLALENWPGSYAGLWGDNARSDTLFVAFTEDAPKRATELGRLAGLPDGQLVPVTAEYSLVYLRQLQQRIARHRDQASKGDRRMPGTNGGQFDLDINVRHNQIEVLLPNPSKTARQTFVRYGHAVVVRKGGLGVPLGSWR